MTSFIEGIKDKNASRLLNNSVVVFEYNDRNGVILPVLPPGLILSRQETQELIKELQKFCDKFTDADIEEANSGILNQQPVSQVPERQKIPGWVYLVKAENLNQYKIGLSKTPKIRLKALQKQSPVSLTLIHLIKCADMAEVELRLHQQFAKYRIIGEWFGLDQKAVDYICSLEEQP